jgi:hypothetical protein
VWCNQPRVRQLLEAATSGESLFEAKLQEFDSGLIFEMDQEVRYILESQSNGWERIE